MELISGLLIATAVLILYVITSLQQYYNYWGKRNIPCLKPSALIGTTYSSNASISEVGKQNKEHYNKANKLGYKHVGYFFFWKPIYMPVDPQLIKTILSKDFSHFNERGIYVNQRDDPLSAHLFSLDGNQWRKLRVKLTPTFTSGKMKMMFQILLECSDQLKDMLNKVIPSRDGVIEMKEMFRGFTTNVIVSCAFGIDCNIFQNKNTQFSVNGGKIIESSVQQFIKSQFAITFPRLAKLIKLKLIDPKISDFFYSVISETVEYRSKNNVKRNDLLQLLIDIQNTAENEDDKLTNHEIAAQALIFFLGGFETSSSAMTFALYELSMEPEIQEKTRKEIIEVLDRHDNILSYDAMMEMKYLDQVVHETLRKHPSFPILNRYCVKNFNIPETDAVIEKGTTVLISTMGLHYNPDFFPNPEKFDPERFNEENKTKIVPFTFLPFGDGPRNCIGSRFGLMQTKIGLITVLKNYSVSLNSKTEVPLDYESGSFLLCPRGGVWFNIEKLEY